MLIAIHVFRRDIRRVVRRVPRAVQFCVALTVSGFIGVMLLNHIVQIWKGGERFSLFTDDCVTVAIHG